MLEKFDLKVSSTLKHKDEKIEGKHIRHKAGQSKCKNLWSVFEPYFIELPEPIQNAINEYVQNSVKIESAEDSIEILENENLELLSLFVINRLAAIAKMLSYCAENKMEVDDFMDGRIYQKIKAKLNNQKQKSSTFMPHNSEETKYCPALEEIDYLLSIGKHKTYLKIAELKAHILTVKGDNAQLNEKTDQLSEVSMRNKRLFSEIATKMARKSEVRKADKQQELEKLIEKYVELTTNIRKRKKRVNLKNTKKAVKKPKIEDLSTDSRSTPKDQSSNYSPLQAAKAPIPKNNNSEPIKPQNSLPSTVPNIAPKAKPQPTKFKVLATVTPFPSKDLKKSKL